MQLSGPADRDTRTAPDPAAPAAETPEIDLERALWDLDYRAQALEMLRRARSSGEPGAALPRNNSKTTT
jgi:hypothetical protein